VNRLIKAFPGAALLALAAGLFFYGPTSSAQRAAETPGWSSIQWPFPIDAWPEGRAFHCGFEECGVDVDLYIRSKIGFCDCYRGVSDDDEIDRVGDLVVLSGTYAPLSAGTAVNLGNIQGRARHFAISAPNQTKRYAIGIALSRKCDAIVATVVGDKPLSGRAEDSAFKLLNSQEIKKLDRGNSAVLGCPTLDRYVSKFSGCANLPSLFQPSRLASAEAMSKRVFHPSRLHLGVLAVVAALFAAVATATAQNPERPTLHFHADYVEELARTTTLTLDDPLAVFAFVLNSLPDRVKVYPTENYYYFSFIHNATPYAGNIRIERDEGDKVSLHFAYFETAAEWRTETPGKHVVFGASQGVTLEKLEPLIYRVSYGGKSVVFALNDLSQVRPPAGALAPGEKFIGPIFDDSGIRFFFVYNSKLKIFLYILDETVKVAEELFPYEGTDRILVGKRTGFAYYRDHKLDRKILIGVLDTNVRLNNYFDGPFDQLPDNFIEGETLREAILEMRPNLKGKIDRFGRAPDGEQRLSIVPYLQYFELRELDAFHKCARRKIQEAVYYNCFVAEKLGFNVPGPDLFENVKKQPAGKPAMRP
jgi:hypothetical protein